MRLWQRLSSDFGSDYEILKMVCDYATLTRPAPSPLPCPDPPALPSCKFRPRSAGLPLLATTPDHLGLCPTAPPRCPGRRKNWDVAQLATPGKRPVHGLYRPCNSGIICRLYRDGTRKHTQDDNMPGWKSIPPKNKPLRTPLEPPHGNGTKKPATMGGR